MSYKLSVTEGNTQTIQDLLRLQAMSDEALENSDAIMVRLHQFDLGRLWEKLELTPCLVCFHGNHIKCNQQCRWFSRCISTLKAGAVSEQEDGKYLEVTLNFEIQ